MAKSGRYAAFLSYASRDRNLVERIKELFGHFRERVFFAREALGDRGSPDWRREIVEAVQNSACFIHVCTNRSIHNPWVLYESGAADAYRKKRFAARVQDVAVANMIDLPGQNQFVYELFNKDQLVQLVTNVLCEERGGNRSGLVREVTARFGTAPVAGVADRIVSLASTRWVFLAGNTPRGAPQAVIKKLREFTECLTKEVLDEGLSVVSCPQVKTVGLAAARVAIKWEVENPDCGRDVFRIGGLYPIDRMPRELAPMRNCLEMWRDQLMAYRRGYLEGVTWLVLVGGNEGTLEEYNAAKGLTGIRTIALPCFGGAAEDIWRTDDSTHARACMPRPAKMHQHGNCHGLTVARFLSQS